MCGVMGVIGSQSASRDVYAGLLALQHRGQDAAGILSFNSSEQRFHLVRGAGLVSQTFDRGAMDSLSGDSAIGHTRYSTVGLTEDRDIQPSIMPQPFGIGMAHNGNLSNYKALADRIRESQNRYLQTGNDLEVLQCLLAEGISSSTAREKIPGRFVFDDLRRAVELVFDVARGGYAVVGIIAGKGMYAFRDPNGIRPLVLGRRDGDGSHAIASETSALNITGHRLVRHLEPGEIVFIENSGEFHSARTKVTRHSPCMFEWVYFASAESEVEGRGVYGARLELGRALAKIIHQKQTAGGASPDIDMVVPVPDTSRTAAIALAETMKVPYRDVLIKNRYVFRSFILNTQAERERALKIKLAPVASEIAGKSVLLVDDSVVRGTTARRLVALVRAAGARKVYMASTCPPVRHPCFYGIDFPDAKGLVAHGRDEAQIAAEIGVDGLFYLDMKGLREAIGLPSLCTACLDGDYPVPVGDEEVSG